MKSRVVLGVLALVGSLALSATAAQAFGGSPFPILSFFVCHPINADASGMVVDVEASVFGTNPQNVTIGQGILACVVAKLFPGNSTHIPGNEINPSTGVTNQEGLKCYTFSGGSRKPGTPGGIPDSYTVTDALAGTDPDVQAGQLGQYICAPANFSLNP